MPAAASRCLAPAPHPQCAEFYGREFALFGGSSTQGVVATQLSALLKVRLGWGGLNCSAAQLLTDTA